MGLRPTIKIDLAWRSLARVGWYMKIIFMVFALICSMQVSAVSLNKIVVFGDSLSDNGNLYEYMKHQLPVSPPYFEGRFTNGLAWVELLTQLYYPNDRNRHLLDYAFGGAGVTVSDVEDDDDPLFTLRSEIDSYLLAHQDKASPSSLFIIWMGSNNYLAIPDDVDKAVDDVNQGMIKSIQRLIDKGAKHMMIINVPDLGKTPAAMDFDAVDLLTELTTKNNVALEKNVMAFQANNPGVQWFFFDANGLLSDMLLNPSRYGFSNVTDTCYEELVNNPSAKSILNMVSTVKPHLKHDVCDGYLFFDPVHPSEPAHIIMATKIRQLLDKAGVVFG